MKSLILNVVLKLLHDLNATPLKPFKFPTFCQFLQYFIPADFEYLEVMAKKHPQSMRFGQTKEQGEDEWYFRFIQYILLRSVQSDVIKEAFKEAVFQTVDTDSTNYLKH